ncbi:hypothetical protein STANM309S_03659 [Streptomyces tanashiensis]
MIRPSHGQMMHEGSSFVKLVPFHHWNEAAYSKGIQCRRADMIQWSPPTGTPSFARDAEQIGHGPKLTGSGQADESFDVPSRGITFGPLVPTGIDPSSVHAERILCMAPWSPLPNSMVGGFFLKHKNVGRALSIERNGVQSVEHVRTRPIRDSMAARGPPSLSRVSGDAFYPLMLNQVGDRQEDGNLMSLQVIQHHRIVLATRRNNRTCLFREPGCVIHRQHQSQGWSIISSIADTHPAPASAPRRTAAPSGPSQFV